MYKCNIRMFKYLKISNTYIHISTKISIYMAGNISHLVKCLAQV